MLAVAALVELLRPEALVLGLASRHRTHCDFISEIVYGKNVFAAFSTLTRKCCSCEVFAMGRPSPLPTRLGSFHPSSKEVLKWSPLQACRAPT